MSRLSDKIEQLETEIRVSKVDALITRVRQGFALHEGAVSHEPYRPVYFVRPEKYRIPTLTQWKRWIRSRTGVFTLHNTIKVLCICCGMPIDTSIGDKVVIGARGKKQIVGNSAGVVVGAVVKWTQEEVQTWNVYNSLVSDVVEIETHKVYRVVTHKALGCIACQSHMLTVKAEIERSYQRMLTEYMDKMTEYRLAVDSYHRQCLSECREPDPALINGLTNPKPSPNKPTAYILVDPNSIQEEQTVTYWRQQC